MGERRNCLWCDKSFFRYGKPGVALAEESKLAPDVFHFAEVVEASLGKLFLEPEGAVPLPAFAAKA